MLSVDEQMRVIGSGADRVIPEELLRQKLERGRPLTVKLGVDPTSPDLHLGHAVALRKMRQFQDLGHQVTLIIGNGTALVGDPSGRNSTRPQLSSKEIEANARTYVEQAMKILNPAKTKVVFNGDWLLPLDLQGILKLASNFTVARILERDDFTKRYRSGAPIALHEFLYPVLQAYDSVVIEADVEMGGSDQLFNLLAGRELMEKRGLEPQVALTMPLLVGTDGRLKMSKSYGNYVGLTDPPNEMYGKLMSIPDELVPTYWRLAADISVDEMDAIDAAFAAGEADPYESKRALARNICDLYHGLGAGDKAEAAFLSVYRDKKLSEDVEDVKADLSVGEDGLVYVPRVMANVGIVSSAGEGRRAIDGGGVRIDNERLSPKTYNVAPEALRGHILRMGKRKAVRLV